jgi:CMP-N-acetylneuraminic acid synthetase
MLPIKRRWTETLGGRSMTSCNRLAYLIIKAHSQRVPGKNFRLLGGKPLYRWILDSLLSLSEVDRIVINTDARALLEEHGLPNTDRLEIRDRPPALCGDSVSANDLIAADLPNLPAASYLMTHATNPFLRPETIRAAIRAWEDSDADSLFTVARYQSRFYQADATPINHSPTELQPTQDLAPWFEENSCLYLFTANSFHATKSRIGARPLLFENARIESIDIDTEDDWALAELIAHGV